MRLDRFFLPRMELVLFAAIFWGVAASGPRILNFDGDLPRHILMGKLILQTHEVSTTDMFSFRTVGYASIPHEWLSQVIFATAYDWLDLGGIVLVTASIIMLTWVIVYYETLRQSRSLFASLYFTALAVAASQIHVLPRPHLFTYVLTAIWVTVLEHIDKRSPRAWWLLPMLMLLWVNLHGMFVIGIIIWGIYLAGDFLDQLSKTWFSSAKAKALIAGGFLSLAMTLLSPSGIHIWTAITSLGSNAYITSRIPEYQSPDFHQPETWPFLILLVFLLISFARSSEKLSWRPILLVVSLTALALFSSRMIPLFAIVLAPVATKAFTGWIQTEYQKSRFSLVEKNIQALNSFSHGYVWLLIMIMAVIVSFSAGRTLDPEQRGNGFDEDFFPVQAATWLQHHPQRGNMFNEFDWGGYLLLKLWPSYQIFMDGHTHIYGEELTREYEKIKTLDEGWQDLLNKYQVNWAILRVNEPLGRVLQEELHWKIVYRDRTAIILVRR